MEVTLHEHQGRALRSTKRFVAMIAGTGGGKTFFGPIWLAQEIQKYPKESFLVIAPTYKMLSRATIPMLQACFRGVQGLQGELKESKGLYALPGGGIIYFGSADRPETLEGVHVKACWMDEAGQMKYMAWIVTQARVGRKLGRVLITTTPYAINWLYYDFYKIWEEGKDPNYDVIQFSSIESPYYPFEEYQRAEKVLDPRLFDMRYRGLFRKMAGLVYRDFDQKHIIEPFDIPKQWRRFVGIDFGYNNPFVAIFVARDKDHNYYIYDEHYQSEMLLKEHRAQINKKAGTDKISNYYPDPSAKQDIEELRALGVGPIELPNNDTKIGIEKVNELVKNNRLKVFKTCKNTIDEFETYHYPEKKEDRESEEEPVKFNDHALDALRYAIMGCTNYAGGGIVLPDRRKRGNYGFKRK